MHKNKKEFIWASTGVGTRSEMWKAVTEEGSRGESESLGTGRTRETRQRNGGPGPFLREMRMKKWAKIPPSNHSEALGISTLVLGVLVLNGNGQYQFLYNKQIDCIWQNLTGQLKKEEWEIRKREESREKVENQRRKREKKQATHKGARTMQWKGEWGVGVGRCM